MKRRLVSILSIAFILLSVSAGAQINIAPEAGFNLSGLKENGNATDNTIRLSGKFGAIVDMPLDSNFYIQSGLFYSMQGQSITDYVSATNYIQLPVNVLYKIGKRDKDRFFVGLGVYGAYAVSDKFKSGKEYQKMPIGNSKQDALKPFDLGANVRLGHEMHNGLFLAAQYSMGLVNTYPGNDFNEKNWVISVTIGYLIHLKHKNPSAPKGELPAVPPKRGTFN